MGYSLTLDEYDEGRLVQELVARRIARDAGQCDYCHHPAGQPIPIYQRPPENGRTFNPVGGGEACRFPERHRGEVGGEPLFISDVSRVSRARAKRWHPGFPDDDNWTGADWSNAMAGEAGEACNVVKKLRRIETGAVGKLDPPEEELVQALADEIADVFLYLDLLAAKYSIDIEAALRSKFNRVSELQGFPERLR